MPIGRPISNAAIYLLDEHLDPVPIGVTGEVYVGGAGVARGYWKRPDLTAERFIPDPFGPPGARLYRTGDLARYSVDGDIEFLGRVDRQVKLRGLRIELGEVESALLSAPGVREAAVAVKSDAPTGEQQLVGYIAMREGHETARKLRDLLAERLPRYMVPTAFVLVDKLPLGPTGKIDRDALARLPMVAPNPSAPPAEEVGLSLHDAIRAIWMQLLQVEEVGIDDNFFDIGGSSMSLVRASRLMKDRIGFDVKVIDLFRYPTIRALCASLAGAPTRAAAHPDHINRHEGNARLATLRQSKERRKAS